MVPKNPARFHAPGLVAYLSGLAQGTEVFRMAEDTTCSLLLIPRPGVRRQLLEVPLDRHPARFESGLGELEIIPWKQLRMSNAAANHDKSLA